MTEQQFPEPTPPTEAQPPYDTYAPAPPQNNYFAPPARPKRRFHPALWSVPALVVGLIGGAAVGSGTTAQADAAKPIPTVTQTQTKTVNVPTTPPSCNLAISLADQTISDAASAAQIMYNMMTQIDNRDAAGLAKSSSDLSVITGKLTERKTPYLAAKSACTGTGS
jgi:hypothetical protein